MVPDHADPPRRLIIESVSLTSIRSYSRLELRLEPGVVLAVGPNGAGKTNLLESLHVGTQGFSPRTRADAEVITFGSRLGRIGLEGMRAQSPLRIVVALAAGEGKRAELNGVRLRAAEQLRRETATLVFTPDRLAIVKGGPATRRAYFDRSLGRLFPARASLPAEYAAALAQRNAALRRLASGLGSGEALVPWTERVASLGSALVQAREDVLAALSSPFAAEADALGVVEATLAYEGLPPTTAALEERLQRDVDRGTTGLGPHLDDVSLATAGRDLRRFGSQGEQRSTVLALLLAEAELVSARRGEPALLLLDDVLSELDPERRRVLARQLEGRGQTLITATTADAFPAEPAQLLHVSPGAVRWSG